MTAIVHPAVPLRRRAESRIRRTVGWLTIREAAGRLGLSRRRVAELVEEERFATVVRRGTGVKAAILIADHCVDAECATSLCQCREWG